MRPDPAPVAPAGDGPFTCDDVDRRLEAYVDDMLPESERQRLDAHLARCAVCAEQLTIARRVRRTLASMPIERCPTHVSDRVLDQVGMGRTPTPHPRFLRRRGWWPTALAAALAAALGVGYLLQPAPGPSSREIAQAQADVELALAYLGRFGEHAGTAVRHDVIQERLAGPIARSVQSALGQED